ncbi:MAG: peptidylprolyl isomerase [Comamonas sp.]
MKPSTSVRTGPGRPSARRAWLAAALSLLLAAPATWAQTPANAKSTLVRLKTSLGDIVLQIDGAKAPVTAANFIQYVQSGQYDGTIFHRVIGSFMIQGGGFDANMQERPTRAPIRLEAGNGLRNTRGTIAMARTRDPDSASAQFFINVVDNPNLDAPNPDGHGYAVFGRVVQGMEVVDRIRSVQTGSRGVYRDVPLRPVIIHKALIERPAP